MAVISNRVGVLDFGKATVTGCLRTPGGRGGLAARRSRCDHEGVVTGDAGLAGRGAVRRVAMSRPTFTCNPA